MGRSRVSGTFLQTRCSSVIVHCAVFDAAVSFHFVGASLLTHWLCYQWTVYYLVVVAWRSGSVIGL